MKFFNLGAGEFLLILLFAIIAIGPKETVRLAGQAREIIRSVQSYLSDITSEMARIPTEILDTANEKCKEHDAS
jgi:Sec-independent protein translocase protein TatA